MKVFCDKKDSEGLLPSMNSNEIAVGSSKINNSGVNLDNLEVSPKQSENIQIPADIFTF